jgi:hypothetical protein
MPGLLNIPQTLAATDARRVIDDLIPVLRQGEDWLATKFPDGAERVKTSLEGADALSALTDLADTEDTERTRAVAEQTALYAEVRAYLQTARRRARRVCKKVEVTDKPTATAIAVSMGLGSKLKLTRVSDMNRLLEKTVTTHRAYAALLRTWGSTDAFLLNADSLLARIPTQSQSLRKEQSEAEAAIATRNAQAHVTIRRVNDLIETVEVFGPEEQPKLFQSVASILNKYNALLTRDDDTTDDADTDA